MQTKTNHYTTPKGYKDYETYRNFDNRACEIVNDFLDEKFYPYITKAFKRTQKFDKQVKGIDCVFADRNHNHYICDEKSAVKYSNKTLNTYAFELQFINRAGNLQPGWFLSDNQTNNSYNLIYTDKIYNEEGDFDYHTFTTDQIKVLHAYIVRKETIKNYLHELGLTTETILKKCEEIRKTNGDCYLGDIDKDGYCYRISKQLPEQPINLLINRNMLDVLSDYTYIYNKGKFTINFNKK